MRFSFSGAVLAVIFSAGIGALASPVTEGSNVLRRDDTCVAEYCPSTFQRRDDVTSPSSQRLTNGQRLARGLPPNPPTRRDGAHRPHPSSTPHNTKRGYIQVTDTSNDNVLGYISKNSLSKAQYGYQPDVSDALIVNFQVGHGPTSYIDFNTENSDIQGFSLAGFVQGRESDSSDLADGSPNYVYIASTKHTSPNSTPQNVGNSYTTATGLSRTSESSVWSINLSTNDIALQWVNSDKSKPIIFNFAQGTALYAGGDPDQFFAKFPAPITKVSYKFVPI